MDTTSENKPIFRYSNIDRLCIVCLEEKDRVVHTESTLEFQNSEAPGVRIIEILEKLTQEIEQPNIVPTIICNDCLNALKPVYLFILKYQESLKTLGSCVFADLKIEKSEEPECNNSEIISPHYGTRASTRNHCLNNKNLTRKNRKRKINVESDDSNEESAQKSDKLHTCPICTKEFTALDLRDHAHTHKALRKYLSIPEHLKVTPTTNFYYEKPEVENVSIFNQEERIHKCLYCNLHFNVEDFRVHLEEHRNKNEFKCETCGRVFKRVNHLNTHRIKHLKEFPYKCDQCGKGFVIKNNYDCHILTHTNDELPHECRFCFRRFSNPEHLNRHQIIHTENVSYSVKYKVCKCHHCLKTFKDKGELQAHSCVPVERAVNAKYPCKTCKKVFKHSSGLYNHHRNVHKLKATKTLCSVCGNYVSNIYNHMMRHTGEKPFKCDLCEKRFIAKPQLKQHLLVHSGLKPYVCSICGKAFNNLYNLQVHERIHKGDRCHICSVCSKGFLEKSYLKKHMNVHTKTPG